MTGPGQQPRAGLLRVGGVPLRASFPPLTCRRSVRPDVGRWLRVVAAVFLSADVISQDIVLVGIPQSASKSSLPGATVQHKLAVHNVHAQAVTWSHEGCNCPSANCQDNHFFDGAECVERKWACFAHNRSAGPVHLRKCGVDVNECESEPCQNGGTCTDSLLTKAIPAEQYRCVCSSGFSGSDCDIDDSLTGRRLSGNDAQPSRKSSASIESWGGTNVTVARRQLEDISPVRCAIGPLVEAADCGGSLESGSSADVTLAIVAPRVVGTYTYQWNLGASGLYQTWQNELILTVIASSSMLSAKRSTFSLGNYMNGSWVAPAAVFANDGVTFKMAAFDTYGNEIESAGVESLHLKVVLANMDFTTASPIYFDTVLMAYTVRTAVSRKGQYNISKLRDSENTDIDLSSPTTFQVAPLPCDPPDRKSVV